MPGAHAAVRAPSPIAALARFGRFYGLTSLVWDSFRAVGNVVMVALLGPPILVALARFRERFTVVIEPVSVAPASSPGERQPQL